MCMRIPTLGLPNSILSEVSFIYFYINNFSIFIDLSTSPGPFCASLPTLPFCKLSLSFLITVCCCHLYGNILFFSISVFQILPASQKESQIPIPKTHVEPEHVSTFSLIFPASNKHPFMRTV